MEAERDAVKVAIESYRLTRPWLFEKAPASSQDLEESYLSMVRRCDVFVLVVGSTVSEYVQREYRTAVAHKRPVLAFVQAGTLSDEQQSFVRKIRKTKYAIYRNPHDLHERVNEALWDQLIRPHRITIQALDVPNIFEGLPPPRAAAKITSILGYALIGVEGKPYKTLLESFGGESSFRTPNTSEYEEIVFDDAEEMREVFTALTRIMSRASEAGRDKQRVFQRAWKEEVLSRSRLYAASRFAEPRRGLARSVRQIIQRAWPIELVTMVIRRLLNHIVPPTPTFKYYVLGVRSDYAPYVQLMRPKEIVERSRPLPRGATEIFFDPPNKLRGLFSALQQATRNSGGDTKKFWELLYAAALRSRFPDSNEDGN